MRSWQIWRVRLNHDRLGNGLCIRLARCRNILLGEVEVESENIFPSPEECSALLAEVAELIREFPFQMSPKAMFGEAPLCYCSKSVLLWLPGAIHALWLERFNIPQLLQQAENVLGAALDTNRQFFDTLESTPQLVNSRRLLQSLESFQECLTCLSAAISRFPDRILVP